MGIKSVIYYVLKCDLCTIEFENSDGGVQCFDTYGDAVDTAKNCDWTLRQGKWRCPACVEQP